jgi:16S rRNA C1402 (ribose-2'-O) methylase RsmI
VANNSKPTLWIVGVPLSDSERITEPAKSAIASGTLWIGESRKRTDWALRQAGVALTDAVFFLDPLPPPQEKALKEEIKKAASQNGTIILLSDTGMPVLFDPGSWILTRCRELGFQIRSASGPTSWSTA